MNIWIAGICACSLAVSLLLLLLLYRGRRLSPLGLAASSLLQLAIWVGAWLLYQPPHWSQAPDSAQITSGTQPAADDPRFFPRQLAALNWVALTGEGLSRAALLDMPPVRLRADIDYSDPAWQVHWQRALSLGEKLEIQLRTDTPFAADTQLLLRDPFGSEIDRREIASADSSVQFALSATPKLVGRWLYQLEIQQGAETRREVIPLVVSEDKKPATLLWLARPSFETAALSRWLRQSGVPARIVTQLAPDIVREESLNDFATAGGKPLDTGNNFDVLILDSHLWPSLTRGQKAQLQQLATRKSLLWLVGQDSTEEFLAYARAQQMPLQKLGLPQPVSAASSGKSSGASSDESSSAPQLTPAGYQPQAVAAADLLLRNSGVPVYWGRSGGAAAQGFVLFGQSYRWVTAGFHREYAELWKAIFDHQLALRGTQAPVLLEPQLPLAQQRVSLCGAASANSVAEIVRVDGEGDRAQLVAVRDPVDINGNCVEFWPEEPGWYRLSSEKQIFEFYVFPEQAWPWWQRWTVRADTSQMADARLGPKLVGGAERRPLPLQWIALLLIALLAIAWWWERKM